MRVHPSISNASEVDLFQVIAVATAYCMWMDLSLFFLNVPMHIAQMDDKLKEQPE